MTGRHRSMRLAWLVEATTLLVPLLAIPIAAGPAATVQPGASSPIVAGA